MSWQWVGWGTGMSVCSDGLPRHMRADVVAGQGLGWLSCQGLKPREDEASSERQTGDDGVQESSGANRAISVAPDVW